MAVNAKRLESLKHSMDQALSRWLDLEVLIQKFLELLEINLDFEGRKLVLESCGERLDAISIELRLKVFNLLFRWHVLHTSGLRVTFYDVCSLAGKRCLSIHDFSNL